MMKDNLDRKNHPDHIVLCAGCGTSAHYLWADKEWTCLWEDGLHWCSPKCAYDNDGSITDLWPEWLPNAKCPCPSCVELHDTMSLGPTRFGRHDFAPEKNGYCFHSTLDCIICEKRGTRKIPDGDDKVRAALEKEIADVHDFHAKYNPSGPSSHVNKLVLDRVLDAPWIDGIPPYFFMLENPTPCPCGRWKGSPASWWLHDGDSDLCDCTVGE